MHDISQLRHNYDGNPVTIENTPNDPFDLFCIWMQAALDANINEPNAMAVSTVSSNCFPSSRIVLLKSFDKKGFVFFTNYQSKKASDISNNPNVYLLFYWPDLNQQIRIQAKAVKTDTLASDTYFNSRPRKSQLSALASPQSSKITDKSVLVSKIEELDVKFKREVERPPHWGGFLCIPESYEFWQGRPDRLHDRIFYALEPTSTWSKWLLAP